jgi:SM-20-related protein
VIRLQDEEIEALGQGRPVIRDGVLGDEAAGVRRAIVALAETGGLRPATLSRRAVLDPEQRGDLIAWLGASAAPAGLEGLWRRFEALRLGLNEDAWLGLSRFEVQVACYPGGGARYVRHLDAFPGQSNRKLTALLYLNPGWAPGDGGELRVWLPEGRKDVEPIMDRLVLFLSDRLEHEVLPSHALRYTVTAWMRGREDIPLLCDPGGD